MTYAPLFSIFWSQAFHARLVNTNSRKKNKNRGRKEGKYRHSISLWFDELFLFMHAIYWKHEDIYEVSFRDNSQVMIKGWKALEYLLKPLNFVVDIIAMVGQIKIISHTLSKLI